MNYTFEEYDKLVAAVEEAGGQHLEDKLCGARKYTFTGKVGKEDDPNRTVWLQGCGNYSIFEIPYEAHVPGTNAAVLQPIELCAVCDGVGGFPRFLKAVFG